MECEDTGGWSSLSFRSAGEGKGVTGEVCDFAWGGSRRLRIEDGKLTVEGADRGTLQPGDRITITADGQVLVNGSSR
ncbi:MAG TPA: hypothetical protein VM533_03215 [Fimbriiglobus sp.]|jgi:hypothetical protein|nr:hypothetical protein [Fimbriiglobus sp.]